MTQTMGLPRPDLIELATYVPDAKSFGGGLMI
jgi:hypothetical protein